MKPATQMDLRVVTQMGLRVVTQMGLRVVTPLQPTKWVVGGDILREVLMGYCVDVGSNM